MRNIMEMMISKRDVIVCRGIWYVMTLLSLFGLSISLNLLWPPGDSSSLSRFLRDGAVSATTFYAMTLLRYLFFTDPPSTCYKEFTTPDERLRQVVFSEIAMSLVFSSSIYYSVLFKTNNKLYSLFCISLFTGGIGLIQLSDKFRMETRHAFLTLFLSSLVGYLVFWPPLKLSTATTITDRRGVLALPYFMRVGYLVFWPPLKLSTATTITDRRGVLALPYFMSFYPLGSFFIISPMFCLLPLVLLKALPFKKEKLVLSTPLI